MSVAVVFDSAGTLLRTYRVAKDVKSGELRRGVETTTLTFADEDRALLVLHLHSREVMSAPPEQLISEYIAVHDIGFGTACMRRVIPVEALAGILAADRVARIADLQDCIRAVWECCRKEKIMSMDSGVILHVGRGCIEYTITSGGRPFRGARDTVTRLHALGVVTYVASGDRDTKLIRMADHLGIPRDRVYGFATPYLKARIIDNLKRQHEVVVMVGDGINDLQAMKQADIAILSEQQGGEKPEPLRKSADYIIRDVCDVPGIIERITKPPDRMPRNEN